LRQDSSAEYVEKLVSKAHRPSRIVENGVSLHTRGPDAGGFFVQQGLAFGHRRLSILDLSPNSQQPMIDRELGLGIVFNGCIYNFREMRRELRKHASGRVMLLRDRLGIKPLYYTETANSFRFASTLPALGRRRWPGHCARFS